MNNKLTLKLTRLFTKENLNLIRELVAAEFKTYDYNSLLGILWSLLNPLMTLIILFCVFEKQFGNHIKHYSLYLLIGVVIVNFFINVTTTMFGSLFYNRSIILNTAIPRENFPIMLLLTHFYKLLIELSLCSLLSIYYGAFFLPALLLAVPLIFAYLCLALGIGLLFSLLFCLARDIEHIWRILSRLLLFITPVFYNFEHVSHSFRDLIYWCNPITPFLISLRQILIWENGLNVANYFYSLLLGGCILVIGYAIFVRWENSVAEKL